MWFLVLILIKIVRNIVACPVSAIIVQTVHRTVHCNATKLYCTTNSVCYHVLSFSLMLILLTC